MKKVKIAQIGLNMYSHSTAIIHSLKKQNELFDFVGYALPENERERIPWALHSLEGSKELSVEEIINDPEIEAVAIETDEIYLTKYALMAAQHNKHIYMEKPGGICLADFEKLIEIMKKTGKIFHVGYMYRYNPFVKELIQKVKNGELGEIISVEAQMNCLNSAKIRQWLEVFPGGQMFYLGCHLIDLILQIQGMPERIIPMNKSTGKDSVTGKDFGMAIFEYKNGVSFAKTNAYEHGGFTRRQLVVTGTKATVEIKPFEILVMGGGQYTDQTEYRLENNFDPGVKSRTEVFDRYDEMVASFGREVLGETENPYTYDYELELYRTILKCCGE